MSKVITRLMGGLGNQMFQYAAGHALARRLAVPLLLDRTFLDQRGPQVTWTPRHFELGVLRAPITFATEAEVRRARLELDDVQHRRWKRLLPMFFKDACFVERVRIHDPAFEQLTAPVYLDGYWQNERYFSDTAEALRHELFLPAAEPAPRNADLMEQMGSCVSASLHVRRGDYVSLPEAASFHGVCSVDYYQDSARWLVEQGVDHFFVFSDDPDWVKTNIDLPGPATHINHNTGAESHWDLFLMKHCRHHIIANSSFSWWGAWLGEPAGKIVVAPERWLAGSDAPDGIIPPTWITR
ncbi:MAG TPA: alpha-1,2-fucosyltransferase [Flavobacteriales bacterium]